MPDDLIGAGPRAAANDQPDVVLDGHVPSLGPETPAPGLACQLVPLAALPLAGLEPADRAFAKAREQLYMPALSGLPDLLVRRADETGCCRSAHQCARGKVRNASQSFSASSINAPSLWNLPRS